MYLEIESVADAKWDNAEHTSVTAYVKFTILDFIVPYSFIISEYPDIVEDFENGVYGPVKEYEPL